MNRSTPKNILLWNIPLKMNIVIKNSKKNLKIIKIFKYLFYDVVF